MTSQDILRCEGACLEAVMWCGNRDAKTAWEECPRGDWLLWFAGRLGVPRKLLVRSACDCAERALRYVPDGEDRPRKAIETARRWCDGNATIADVRAAGGAYAAAAGAGTYAAGAYAAAADAERLVHATLVRQTICWETIEALLKERNQRDG